MPLRKQAADQPTTPACQAARPACFLHPPLCRKRDGYSEFRMIGAGSAQTCFSLPFAAPHRRVPIFLPCPLVVRTTCREPWAP